MAISRDSISVSRFIRAIRRLPSDRPVANRQPGYNRYNTQKEHWLGWLGANPPGVGTYARKAGKNRDAKYIYNHIKEPKMLLWLATAARVKPELLRAAQRASSSTASIRKHVPWSEVSAALAAVTTLMVVAHEARAPAANLWRIAGL